ncbi:MULTISPECIES: sugar glycosyltransferase [Pectobacterium]|uniref:sugar glycosyltransferase n=1 Tax=Pectobacterium TaxID=122277 RepID=UPI0015DDA006|nr:MULTISPECIES: sugar glycosyltransferase [Pectobacterium]MBA0185210.1 sugar glycosyltransferase [Pectobacterium versatile]WGL27839.1 sugar glycosyltransferase [Pectobacterium brasiliense]
MSRFLDEFYKLLYRMTHSTRYKHNRKRWPHVKITRGLQGEISNIIYRGKTVPIVPLPLLQGKFSEKIMLVASGPSVNKIPFSKERNPIAIGVNGAYSIKEKIKFNFYIITDIHFFDHRQNIVKEIISDSDILLFLQIDGLTKIIDKFGLDYISCKIAIIEDAYKRTFEPKYSIEEIKNNNQRTQSIYFYDKKDESEEDIAFETNIANGIFPGKTVVYWALQIIIYMGFKDIYIAGLDMNNFNKPRFYESEKDKVYSRLEMDLEKNILPSFTHVSNIVKEKNINIINLSIDSAIPNDVFKKNDYISEL